MAGIAAGRCVCVFASPPWAAAPDLYAPDDDGRVLLILEWDCLSRPPPLRNAPVGV